MENSSSAFWNFLKFIFSEYFWSEVSWIVYAEPADTECLIIYLFLGMIPKEIILKNKQKHKLYMQTCS